MEESCRTNSLVFQMFVRFAVWGWAGASLRKLFLVGDSHAQTLQPGVMRAIRGKMAFNPMVAGGWGSTD